jgi:hypothetical protein
MKGIFQKKRTDEDIVHRAASAADAYKFQLMHTNETRQTYYTEEIPALIKVLKNQVLTIEN